MQKIPHLHILLSIAGMLAIAPAHAADEAAAASEGAFNNACRTCHSWNAGDNRLGPSLAGIIGRKAGQEPGFAYSSAMKTSGITWDAKTLDAFITNPESVVPSNNMKPFTGVSDASLREQIISFLSKK